MTKDDDKHRDFANFKAERQDFRRWWVWGIALLIATVVCLTIFGQVAKVVSTPARVLNKTLDTDNVITQYEFYYDVHEGYLARVGQIREFSGRVAQETDATERRFLNTELSGQRASCRTLVAKYNANSQKLTTKHFKGWALPHRLVLQTCEEGA